MPYTINYKDIQVLPYEARRLWIKVANQELSNTKDDVRAIKVAWDVIKKAGYSKKGDIWIKECINMLRTNLKGKLDRLKILKYSYKHTNIIKEAQKLVEGVASELDVKIMMSKLDKAANHCLEIAKKDVKESIVENRTEINDIFKIDLKEADFNDDKMSAQVTIIECGFNSSKKRYYTEGALQAGFPIFSGIKMYRNHLTPAEEKSLNGMPRKIEEWMSTMRDTWYDSTGRKMKGNCDFTTIENYTFAKKNKKDIGLSINSSGVVVGGTIEGTKTNIVKEFNYAKSVDWVTEAGAGGKIDFIESKKEEIKEMKWEEVTLEGLTENMPDLVTEIKEQVKKELKEASHMDEKEKEIERLKLENANFQKKIKESEEADNKLKCQEKVIECLKNVKEIPELSVKKIQESFKDLNIKIEDVQKTVESAIKSEREYLISLKEAGSNIKGLGETNTDKNEGEKKGTDKLKEARIAMYKKSNYTDKQIEELEKV